jgi:hypothetical protein
MLSIPLRIEKRYNLCLGFIFDYVGSFDRTTIETEAFKFPKDRTWSKMDKMVFGLQKQ